MRIDYTEFKDRILIENLGFSYSEKPILKSIEFTFEKNKKYAIVGPSGSGKSTLIKLISGKLSPESGNIFIDSIDISNLSQYSLLSLMLIIEQDVFLTGIEDIINDHDTEILIAEQETSLSGVGRQNIDIEGTLIRSTPIVLADEIFANLDNKTAYKVETQLLQLEDVTLISATHRLLAENLRRYDEIIVLIEGKIIEYGSFEQLMNTQSYFKKVYDYSRNHERSTLKKISIYEKFRKGVWI